MLPGQGWDVLGGGDRALGGGEEANRSWRGGDDQPSPHRMGRGQARLFMADNQDITYSKES